MLKQAVEWGVIEKVLLEAARKIDRRTQLIVLLGGDAAVRIGEIVALHSSRTK